MRESYLETRDHWPAMEAPEDLLAYFASDQLSERPDDEICICSRQGFIVLLDEHPHFGDFWTQFRDVYLEKAEYFESLTNQQMYCERKWVEKEYYRYLYKDKFIELSEDEHKELQAQFDKIRLDAFQAALKGEAIRMNCNVSDVRPLCPVLPLAFDGDKQSRLAELPDFLLLKIMNQLDTWDIFRIALVCKKWRSLIYNHPSDLKRVEHAKTTHVITFTDWMDPAKTPSCEMFKNRFEQFSLGLIRWCYGVSGDLETVILDQPISYIDAESLVQSCPNLKHLQIGCEDSFACAIDDGLFSSDVMLPKLEFYSSRMFNCDKELELDMKVLLSCESLLYFGGQLILYQIPAVDIQDRMKHAFGNLIALNLEEYSFDILEMLADVDDLQLRYLGLKDGFPCKFSNTSVQTIRLRDLLKRILPKLKQLEILKLDGVPGIGGSTIKLLTELKLNLKLVVFTESVAHRRSDNFDNPNERDHFNAQVLTDFGEMLLSSNPGTDLSEFYFIVMEEEIPQDLKDMNLGFKFISIVDSYDMAACDIGLNFQSVKRLLGIDF